MRFKLSSPCRGSKTFDAVPLGDVEFSQGEMRSMLERAGFSVVMSSDILVMGRKGSVEVALYRRGKLIIKNVSEKAEAQEIAELILGPE